LHGVGADDEHLVALTTASPLATCVSSLSLPARCRCHAVPGAPGAEANDDDGSWTSVSEEDAGAEAAVCAPKRAWGQAVVVKKEGERVGAREAVHLCVVSSKGHSLL